jgi:AI-2E family transporter
VIEPMIYGHSTGLSPVAVITAATFWTWLWGPIGLILATPLTTCLVVLGRHVEQLKFLQVMFGDEPPLTPAELIYQRMLARDPIEAADQARIVLKEKPLTAYYDEVLLEGLRLAQGDAQRGLLDEDRLHRIRDVVAEIVDDLATHADAIEPTSILQRATLFSLSSKRPRPKLRKKGYRSAGATANPFYAYRDRASSTRL